MPTFESLAQFDREYAKLTREQRKAFQRAVQLLVAGLRDGGFGQRLRVKRVRGTSDVWEMTWAPDGRATWQYGPEQRPGESHVVWRRIGTHQIFRSP